jgi:DNA-binding response OmpR family regulator
MTKILVVEDSAEIAVFVRLALVGLSIEIDFADTIAKAKKCIDSQKYALFLLDLRLPDGDGHSLISYVRSLEEYQSAPILMLSTASDLECKVTALKLGADDYLCKPFQPLELCARVQRMLSRSMNLTGAGLIKAPNGISLDAERNQVRLPSNVIVNLSNTEFRLLAALSRRPGVHFSRHQLLDTVWGSGVAVSDRTIDSHIYAIRRKLGDFGRLIISVPGVGYAMSDL